MENANNIYGIRLHIENNKIVHLRQNRLVIPFPGKIYVFTFRELKWIILQPVIYSIYTIQQMLRRLFVLQTSKQVLHKIVKQFIGTLRNI